MKTTTKRTVKPTPKPTPVKRVSLKTCRAADVGHRSCKCGGPYCGAQIHEP